MTDPSRKTSNKKQVHEYTKTGHNPNSATFAVTNFKLLIEFGQPRTGAATIRSQSHSIVER